MFKFFNPLIYGLCYWFAPWMLKRVTGENHNGVFVGEGQRWRITKPNEEFLEGIYIISSYCGDRVVIKREDGKWSNLPWGVIPTIDMEVLLSNFELVK